MVLASIHEIILTV